ncbi:hypothetical protein WDZ92_40395 [Nostoc sp. NIES-2111]
MELLRQKRVAFLAVVLAAAMFAYVYWEVQPLIDGPELRRGLSPAGRTERLVVFTMPIACFLVARPWSRPFLFVHFSVFLLLLLFGVTGDEGHSSPFSGMGRAVTPIIFGIEAAVLFIGLAVSAMRDTPFPPRVWAAAAAILLGLTAGSTAWAVAMLVKVRSQTVSLAGGQPYCIYSDGRYAYTWLGLTGFRMRNRERGGWHDNFHGLLVGNGQEGRQYFDWPHRVHRDVPAAPPSAESLRLAQNVPR